MIIAECSSILLHFICHSIIIQLIFIGKSLHTQQDIEVGQFLHDLENARQEGKKQQHNITRLQV